jgi:hypothetical protein
LVLPSLKNTHFHHTFWQSKKIHRSALHTWGFADTTQNKMRHLSCCVVNENQHTQETMHLCLLRNKQSRRRQQMSLFASSPWGACSLSCPTTKNTPPQKKMEFKWGVRLPSLTTSEFLTFTTSDQKCFPQAQTKHSRTNHTKWSRWTTWLHQTQSKQPCATTPMQSKIISSMVAMHGLSMVICSTP